jgi:hypothetical protein
METGMTTTKDLNYFLEHPDEMPTDTAEIERLAAEQYAVSQESDTATLSIDQFVKPADDKAGAASGAETDKEAADPAAAVEAAAKAEADAKAAAEAKAAESAAAAEAKPDGVLAKDGKNVIPYAQLESARQRASAAEQLAAEQRAELDRLKNQLEAGKTATTDGDVETLSDEELDALEVESPTLAKLLRGQQATIQKLTGTVETLAKHQGSQIASEEAEVRNEMQEAIDSNPTMAAWQSDTDKTMWNKAAKFDKLLRAEPEFADVSFADRFAKVVELTQAALGLKAEVAAPAAATTKATPAEIKAQAEAKLKSTKALPTSLSDIPGGAPPAVDERERVDDMSATELGAKFLNMKPEDLQAYLTSL